MRDYCFGSQFLSYRKYLSWNKKWNTINFICPQLTLRPHLNLMHQSHSQTESFLCRGLHDNNEARILYCKDHFICHQIHKFKNNPIGLQSTNPAPIEYLPIMQTHASRCTEAHYRRGCLKVAVQLRVRTYQLIQ